MKKILLLIACFSVFCAYSQYTDDDVKLYIDKYADLAVQSMKTYKIPASVKLAQAIYSSNAGQSKVAREAVNHFGLLCNTEYKGETYYETSDRSGNCYRIYNTVEESFQDHNLFLTTRPRYADLFNLPLTDYRAWANGLQSCGYSINPEYAQRLINIIEKYDLTRFDAPEKPVSVNNPEVAEELPAQATPKQEEAIQPVPVPQPEPQPEPVKSAPVAKENVQQEATTAQTTDENKLKPDTIIDGIEVYIRRTATSKKAVPTNGDSRPIISMNVFTAKDNEYRVSYFPYTQRDVYENNKIKFVIAHKGDTYAKIARETQLQESDLRTYNDAYEEYEPVENEVVYLQLKNTKSDISYHKLEATDSFRYLSQKYAIQLKLLTKRNKQPEGGFTVGSLICVDCK